jgi:hypothetical protein
MQIASPHRATPSPHASPHEKKGAVARIAIGSITRLTCADGAQRERRRGSDGSKEPLRDTRERFNRRHEPRRCVQAGWETAWSARMPAKCAAAAEGSRINRCAPYGWSPSFASDHGQAAICALAAAPRDGTGDGVVFPQGYVWGAGPLGENILPTTRFSRSKIDPEFFSEPFQKPGLWFTRGV